MAPKPWLFIWASSYFIERNVPRTGREHLVEHVACPFGGRCRNFAVVSGAVDGDIEMAFVSGGGSDYSLDHGFVRDVANH
jgi:hypothetical protein